ncbi:uncharacterized protein LOC123322389 [Coccinella septempunctata]|uniref:uncharacterized protein LOC123322389 n=1 Tax=Coccinella septempunctata TaxID=41139 RepID=UPI001D070F54|nr:uncharacterized protein LOC123322389 [Coccinella septempunctata]
MSGPGLTIPKFCSFLNHLTSYLFVNSEFFLFLVFKEVSSNLGFNYNAKMETVNFKYGDVKGNFFHSNKALISIAINYTTIRDIITTLAEVAIYIKWDFTNTTGKDSSKVRREIREKIRNKPWEIISASKEDFQSSDWRNTEEKACGCLIVRENTEYCPTGSVKMAINRNLNLILEGTQQEIEVSVRSEDLKC